VVVDSPAAFATGADGDLGFAQTLSDYKPDRY
jgi:hypothetical protein